MYESDNRYNAQENNATGGLVSVALAIQDRLSELIAGLGYSPEDMTDFEPEKHHRARAKDIVADAFCADAIRSIVQESIPVPTCDSDSDNICEIGRDLVKQLAKWHKA